MRVIVWLNDGSSEQIVRLYLLVLVVIKLLSLKFAELIESFKRT